ncbi:hypothetical protein BO70DRAFT_376438 [Aspergillus heteromorphus CBS 117.55]|uniref:Uncharacterized protein n=1 Tax=Aspergillus heteromorphus CBS 117.55 TaxID=1448321 RepID=A0A317X2Q5_9EURO|nr:uncharacterized protein BO70DRAFT_376438 [Aspergillus heteromorphus CBS 117.55]PWY92846.1 hypothetical protein BO70DRAFT_376438 [Aspergillus heteromorphus CBS 117.55]
MVLTDYPGIDESRYRSEVLLLPSEESETSHEQRLADEARELGLKVPEVEAVASLAASIASGMVDLSSSSPIISSGSSTDRNSTSDVTPSLEVPPIDLLASSLSEFTVASEPIPAGSTRSFGSLSTRPTSYSSCEGRLAPGLDNLTVRTPGNRLSMWTIASTDKRERRKSTIKSAIGKIHFRKKRSPSAVLLPPAAQITVAKGEKGVERVFVESRRSESQNPDSAEEENQVLRLEIPVFDSESLQRSQDDTQLRQLRESQEAARDRHVAFQDAFMAQLRRTQQSIVTDQLAANKVVEEKKREKNSADAARMEERQLTVEMEQMREFERAKLNSRTRIKYMEGYFSNSSPPPSPVSSAGGDVAPARKFTAQHKAQLAQELHDHDSMDQLHESKIKVLRDRQELRLQEAIERMERELDEIIDKHALQFAQMQAKHQQEELDVVQAFEAKKVQLRHCWNLEEAILRKKLEVQYEKPYGPLPPLSFNDSHYETRDSAICVSDQAGATSGDEGSVHQKRGGQVL